MKNRKCLSQKQMDNIVVCMLVGVIVEEKPKKEKKNEEKKEKIKSKPKCGGNEEVSSAYQVLSIKITKAILQLWQMLLCSSFVCVFLEV